MSHSSEPFFLPDLLTEVARLWEKPFSTHVYAPVMNSYANIKELDEQGYVEMTRVEKLLANYLIPTAASSWKATALPSKPCQVTSKLIGKAYIAAGQAGVALHTMAVLQAYQADLGPRLW